MRLRTANINNKLEFKKKIGKEIHNFSFEKLVVHLIKDIQEEGVSQNEESSQDSQSESDNQSDNSENELSDHSLQIKTS